MKRSIPGLLCVLLGIIIGACCLVLILNTVPETQNALIISGKEDSTLSMKPRDLVDISMEAAGNMKTGDYEALSELVHPEYGVYFSPGATVVLSSNMRFTAEDVASFATDSTSYVWGVESDSGSPIDMKASDYFSKYVFDSDYTVPDHIGINNIVKSGNDLDNVKESFPEASFVDLYDSGTKEMEYADWSILRLVFEEYNGEYRLTAVIHSEAAL